jgi:replicative DNA helicase
MNDKNFGYLGTGFQQQLLKTLIEDKKFSIIIIDSIDSKYFDGPYFKYLMENIKELYTSYGVIPDYTTLEQKIMKENRDISSRVHIDTLHAIRDLDLPNAGFVKETSLNFCKQQVLKKSLKEVEEIMNNGDFEEYHKIEKIVQKALLVGSTTDSVIDIFENVRESLEDDNRVPFPTGIVGIDNLLKGGIARCEVALLIAPLGVGKTTWLTKVANTAYNVGGNVLHIFFEDNENDIRRKHYTCWTKYSDTEQRDHKDEVVQIVAEKRTTKNFLKLVKLPPAGVSINDIRSIIRKLGAEGQHIDMLVIDYIDCISSERAIDGEEWKGEGAIMRSLEAMKDEFNIAIWVATQGNRESLLSEVVTTDQIGGSLKKAQIGHVVISVGKSLVQKEHNLATVTLLKSRIGKDGVVFTNCKFNNEYLDIDTDTQNTLLGHEEEKAEKKREHIAEVYKAGREKETKIITDQVNKILESKISILNQSHETGQTENMVDEIGAIELVDEILEGETGGATEGDILYGGLDGKSIHSSIIQDEPRMPGLTGEPGPAATPEISPEEKSRQRLRELAKQRKLQETLKYLEEVEVNSG